MPPPWRTAFLWFAPVVNLGLPVLASVANRAVKPTRLRRAAYFRSLARCENRFILAHGLFTGIYLLKRLSAGFFVVCRASPWGAVPVQAFLASSPCAASASSYHFSSSASPPWRTAFSRFAPIVNSAVSVLASGSNCAVKPTCLRQAAYFRSLVPSPALCAQPLISALGPVPNAF